MVKQGVISVKFRRIDENTIRCIITEEDMQEYNVEIIDFFRDRQKVSSFLRTVVERAAEEIGYEVQHGVISMQLVPLAKNQLAITFSDKPETEINDMLEQVKNNLGDINGEFISDLMEQMPEFSEEEASTIFDSMIQEDEKTEQKTQEKTPSIETSDMTAIIEFASMKDVEKYISTISYHGAIKSDLYKDASGVYLLVIEKARMAINRYHSLCENAKEYCISINYNPSRVVWLKEHTVCMIEKKAVKILQGICERS